MNIIGGRWRAVIMYHLLKTGKMRFSEVRRSIPRITQRMLTNDLRALEHSGLVSRKIYAEVPTRVEYSPTPRAKSLLPIIDAMNRWGKNQEATPAANTGA
ncbi:MAG: winged helix-turn-helix transcriptional regulator [Bryobacteraceae bacterium]